MKKILFINFGGLGDEILFLPAIKSIKKEFKESTITLCIEPRSSAISNLEPMIDKMICADIKKKGFAKYTEVFNMLKEIWHGKYDIVISSGKSPLIAVILLLTNIKTRIGYKTNNKKTNSFLTQAVELNENQYAGKMYHDLVKPLTLNKYENPKIKIKNVETIEKILGEKLLNEGFIAIHPGVSKMSIAKNIYKCPNVDFWFEVIEKINEKNKNIALLGGPDDKEIIEKIAEKTDKFTNLYGKTKSAIDMAKVISKADLLICVDSAPMHIGVALNKELIAIFGPTDENKLIPKKDIFHVVTTNVECRPCLWAKRQENCSESKCLNIDINEVLKFI